MSKNLNKTNKKILNSSENNKIKKDLVSAEEISKVYKRDFPTVAYIQIKLKNITKKEKDKFIEYLKNNVRCTGVYSIIGNYDFICIFVAKDNSDLEKISIKIRNKFKNLIKIWDVSIVLKCYKFN
jgi:DNA-binding Lrp family transcriptional regulator